MYGSINYQAHILLSKLKNGLLYVCLEIGATDVLKKKSPCAGSTDEWTNFAQYSASTIFYSSIGSALISVINSG